jgi:DNA-binding NarL/FixJ family response regulator
LVAAKPGRLRESLHLLLTMIPQIAGVAQVEDTASLLQTVSDCPPDLVLIDAVLDQGGNMEALQRLKTEAPLVPCLVIVGNASQRKKARAAGADGMLLRGFTSIELAGIVRRLVT